MEATESFNYSLPVLAAWYLLPSILPVLRNLKKSLNPPWESASFFATAVHLAINIYREIINLFLEILIYLVRQINGNPSVLNRT